MNGHFRKANLEEHPEEAEHQKFSTPTGGLLWKPVHTPSGGVWEAGNKWQPDNRYSISEFLGGHNWSKTKVADLHIMHVLEFWVLKVTLHNIYY